ncbi:hypothetical protein D3C75_301050 [compost metagenome]
MKCKLIYVIVSIVLSVGIVFPWNYKASAADTKTTSVAIPTKTGLTGSDNSAKTYFLDLPNGVNSTAIKINTLKYNGNNDLIGSISVENGKVKIILKGNSQDRTYNVVGKDVIKDEKGNEKIDNFTSVPGNSIWRYSDGRRWQINSYNSDRDINVTFDVKADDNVTPSGKPPVRPVTTKSKPADPSTAKWFTEDLTTIVPYSSIVQSSIKLKTNGFLEDTATVDVKNGQFIVGYSVPSKRSTPEQVPEHFDKGGWVEGRLYYVALLYHFTATAKLTTYSYAGNVTFEYALPDGPSISSYVTVLKPKPNPYKFVNANVDVQLAITGELANYTDTSNISEWVFYAKKKNSSTFSTQKDYTKILKSTSKPFLFTISAAEIAGGPDPFQQEYDLTVTVRFSKPIVTKTGTITDLTAKLGATIEVYKENPSIEIDSVPPLTKGKPPVARIFAPPLVKAGEEFQANGSGSYDPDGDIVGYYFDSVGATFEGYSPTGAQATLWYPNTKLGQNTVKLTVSDKDMLTDSAGTFVYVIEPIPEAKLEIGGTLKQNRKVIIQDRSTSPKHYPLDYNKSKITISAVPGYGGTDAGIKYSGSLLATTYKEVLFKEPGLYKATIYVENRLGYSATTEETFEIVPDNPPVMYISMPGRVYRDPANGNKAVVSIDDLSYSPDGDYITRRTWEYRYDSDNDGSFTDENWVIFSDANAHRLNLVLSEVGKYEIRHFAYETFGQPTIDTFVTAADRRSADTSGQDLDQKTVEVLNLAPEGNWEW